MTPELYRAHAHLARELISACGGVVEAALHCTLEKSRLQDFRDPKKKATMPWPVIHDLEAYSGRERQYANAMASWVGSEPGGGNLKDESCDLSETALRIQAVVRQIKGAEPTESQTEEVCQQLLAAEQALRRIHHDIERGDP